MKIKKYQRFDEAVELETLQDDSESPEAEISDFEEREREREDYDGCGNDSEVSKQFDSDDEGL
jgi:hypothetical protein